MEINVTDEDFNPPKDIDDMNNTAEALAGTGKAIHNHDQEAVQMEED